MDRQTDEGMDGDRLSTCMIKLFIEDIHRQTCQVSLFLVLTPSLFWSEISLDLDLFCSGKWYCKAFFAYEPGNNA